MEPFFEDYMKCLESLHNDLKGALDGIGQDGLDWSPGAEMNSLGVLVAHVCGSERHWIGDVVAGVPSGRDRPAEFRTQGVPVETLVERLGANLVYVRHVLESLSLADLENIRHVPGDNRRTTVGWVLAHVMAHVGVHAGHAQVTRQFLGR